MARMSKRGREAGSGRFVPLKYAAEHPGTTVIETLKVGRIKHRK